MVSALCGGVSRTDGMCGAYLGGVVAFGLLFGRDLPTDDKTLCYTLTYSYGKLFEEEFGSKNCHGVIPCNISTPKGSEQFKSEEIGERVCPQIAAKAAAIVQQLINNKDGLTSHPLI